MDALGSRDARSIDPFLWIGIASCAGGLAIAHPVMTIATSAVLGGLLFLQARGAALLAAVVLLGSFARASSVVGRYEREREAVIDVGGWPSRCFLTGKVARSPSVVSGGLRLELVDAVVHVRDGDAAMRSVHGRVSLHVPAEVAMAAVPMMALARGDAVTATASLAPPYRFWNDGTDDPRPSAARRGVVLSGGAEDLVRVRAGSGVLAWIDRVRARVRDRIVATFPSETSPMARALVLGEDDLVESDRRAFRKSGLAHLLAVSGMHLVLVVTGFVAALRAALLRSPLADRLDVGRIASAIGLPAAWIYADLAGGSGSAVRAAWMCSVVLLARVLARRSSAWRGLGLSILAMSALDPLVVFDVSFVLSALATLGIIALARPLEAAARRRLPLPSFILGPIATSAAATLTCAPVLASMAFELPIGGLVANVIAVPLGEAAALPLCLAHAVLAVWPSAENGCAIAASGALAIVRVVARAFTWGVFPVPPPTAAQFLVLTATFGVIALGSSGRPRARWSLRPAAWLGIGAIVLLGTEIAARRHGSPHGSLRVTFLDVGQGDSALVDLPDGSAMLVDGGGLVGSPVDVGERAVLPLLAARRRRALAVVVLSHPHPDHHLGLASALTRTSVREFWDTGQGEAEGTGGAYRELLTELRGRGVVVKNPTTLCGAHAIGGAIVEVLAPCPDVLPDRGANDNSFVIRIRYGTRAVLLVGDAEHEEEADLIRSRGTDGLRADVLKVGHHGSRTSSTRAFIDTVAPSVAVISCGVRNRFGHPHPNTLATLTSAGVRVLRTDRHGSVVVTTDGTSLDVRSMSAAEPSEASVD
jgi:competence protein ComEC